MLLRRNYTLLETMMISNINLKLGYQHVSIEQIDVWKITLKFKEGLFEWLVVIFGLTNAPTTFMRVVDDSL
jgi:hypothetical protein